jgi:hypothetical protein
MKSKIILGLATLVGLALPSFAAQTYCRLDNDGDRQICTTTGYDAWGNYYQRNFSRPVYNGYYGGYYNNGFYANRYRRDYDGDYWRDRREDRERREHREHEYREHHRDRDHDGDYR